MYLTANTSLETHIPPPAASSIAFHEIQDKGMTNGLQNAAGLQQVNTFFPSQCYVEFDLSVSPPFF